MEQKALIIINIAHEGPGRISEALESAGVNFQTVHSGDASLPDPSSYSMLFVMGGPDSANDNNPKMNGLVNYVRQWLSSGKPYLGICLGMQVLAKAAGAIVKRHDFKEIGFSKEGLEFRVDFDSKLKDALFGGRDKLQPIFHLHGETVVPSGQVEVIGRGNFCPAQVIRAGRLAWGIQGHIELTAEMLESWCRHDEDLSKIDTPKLLAQYRDFEGGLKAQADSLFRGFIGLSKLLSNGEKF